MATWAFSTKSFVVISMMLVDMLSGGVSAGSFCKEDATVAGSTTVGTVFFEHLPEHGQEFDFEPDEPLSQHNCPGMLAPLAQRISSCTQQLACDPSAAWFTRR